MTPLERAVDAVENMLGVNDELCATPEEVARAVIEAIREPSSEMTHAAQGESHVAGDCEVDYHGIWASMIDQLLAEGGK
jgi:hypothetical protein